jgi:RNase H-like domain found in reverse transcriptase
MDCLGHIIDKDGIHPETDKMAKIREWHMPRSYNDIKKFLGLVQYLQHFMPNVSAYMAPLSGMTRNNHTFKWRPLHQKYFDMMKTLACQTPILHPIDVRSPDTIWVICDASASRVGALYGQGPEWNNCRLAGFMSKKFHDAQFNYCVFEMETLAILEALLKWEDKLIECKFIVVTDYRLLEFFQKQRKLSNHQA